MRALLVVLTDPADPGHDEAYNRWYTEEHLPDVLAVPGYVRATRYRAMDGDGPLVQRYLSLYELEVEDLAALQAVSDEHMRRIAAGEMRRSPPGAMSRASMRAMYYAATGPRLGDGDTVPATVLLVFTQPASAERELEYNRWYQAVHLPEVLDVPGFVAASRYVTTDINMLGEPWVVPLRYLAVAELAEASKAAFQATMAEVGRRAREGDRMDVSPALGAQRLAQAFARISPRVTAPGAEK